MAQEKHVILRGKFFDTLYQTIEDQPDTNQPSFYRKQNLKGGAPVLRSHLTLEHAVEAINKTGLTVHELFIKALGSEEVPELSNNDKRFLTALETLTEEQQHCVQEIINTCQNPWWDFPVFNEPDNIKIRFQTIVKNKYPMITRKDVGPIFKSLNPLRDLYAIETDLIPAVCEELSCAYPFAMRLGFAVSYYSKKPGVDKIFHYYKLMQPDLQYIPLHYAKTISKEGK